MPVRVVLADDSLLMCEALTHVLEAEPSIELVGVCGDRDSLMKAVDAEEADVVVTDIRMPPGMDDEGIRVASELRTTHPNTGVVILSQFAEARYALELLQSGSDGRAYLLKDRIHDRRELVAAIQATAEGASVIDPRIVEILVDARASAGDSALAELTPRERQILGQIAQGKSNAAIASTLGLSKRAVEKHINSIFFKLDLTESAHVSRRVKAALMYLAEDGAATPSSG